MRSAEIAASLTRLAMTAAFCRCEPIYARHLRWREMREMVGRAIDAATEVFVDETRIGAAP
jgi:hypothetical protein